MGNRLDIPKPPHESKIDSICKLADREDKDYLFFDPDNITNFKAIKYYYSDNDYYLYEFIQTMWGNDEISEYILLNQYASLNGLGEVKEGVIEKYNIKYEYTESKNWVISRYYYNVVFEYKNIRYYVYIKTIAPRLDKLLNTLKLKEEV